MDNTEKKKTPDGKEYLYKTRTYCSTCGYSGNDNFYYVTAKLGSGDLVVECMNCGYERTLPPSMITIDD